MREMKYAAALALVGTFAAGAATELRAAYPEAQIHAVVLGAWPVTSTRCLPRVRGVTMPSITPPAATA